jgi:hypothetical protein
VNFLQANIHLQVANGEQLSRRDAITEPPSRFAMDVAEPFNADGFALAFRSPPYSPRTWRYSRVENCAAQPEPRSAHLMPHFWSVAKVLTRPTHSEKEDTKFSALQTCRRRQGANPLAGR